MNNSVYGKTIENKRNHRDIKLVTTEKRRSKLVLEPNYHTTKHFSENLLGIEMKKTKVTMNKPVYLGMIILDISKTRKYENEIPKYGDRAKHVTWILIALYPFLKLNIFLKTLLMMLKGGLIHLAMIKDRFQ